MTWRIFKNALFVGLILQMLLLCEVLALLDGHRHFILLFCGFTLWNAIWLAVFLCSKFFPARRTFRSISHSLIFAASGPVIVYLVVNIGDRKLWVFVTSLFKA